jgi:hypothetical protein
MEREMGEQRKQIVLELLAEVFLSFLPITLLMLVLLHGGKSDEIFLSPEWAFAASIFFGQAIVRLVSAMAQNHRSLHAGFLSVVVVLLILLGLGPSCAIVVLVLSDGHSATGGHATALPIVMQYIQVILYLFSAVSYVFVGTIVRELEK